MHLAVIVILAVTGSAPLQAQASTSRTRESLNFVQLTAGDRFTCGLAAGGAAYCWGRNDAGQLGTPTSPHQCTLMPTAGPCATEPQRVAGGQTFAYLDAGDAHVCGVTPEGTAYCWGSNISGALGTDTPLASCVPENPAFPRPSDLLPGCSRIPVPVAGNLRFTSLSVGDVLTCGVTVEGHAYCWGMDQQRTSRSIQRTPVRIAGDQRFTAITVDFYQACALDRSGAVYCWADGIFNKPTRVPAPATFKQLSRGWGQNCALTSTGKAYCWGDNDSGQVGTGRVPKAHEKVDTVTAVAGGLRFREIRAGFGTTCGITTERALYCWGKRAGVKATAECFHVDAYAPCTPRPVRVTAQQFRSVAIGTDHLCAVTVAGVGYCWGADYYGSFGTGPASTLRDTPRRVIWQAPLRELHVDEGGQVFVHAAATVHGPSPVTIDRWVAQSSVCHEYPSTHRHWRSS